MIYHGFFCEVTMTKEHYHHCRHMSELSNHYIQPDDFYNPLLHIYEFLDDKDRYHYYKPDFVGNCYGDITIRADNNRVYSWSGRKETWYYNHLPVSHFSDVDCPRLFLEAIRVSVGSERILRIHRCLA